MAAFDLALWMAQEDFFVKTLYGEKDCVRLALLMLGVPFEMVDEVPWQLCTNTESEFHRVYFMSMFRGRPFNVDQVKSQPNLNAYHVVGALEQWHQ